MKHSQNIKYQISKIKDTVKNSKILNISLILLFFTILLLNLMSSQLISPLYSRIVSNDKTATITFLQKIKKLPEYQNILKMNNNIYGNSVKEEILRQENKKKEIINNLEKQLIINPKIRDVLYNLYKLYLDEGDNDRAMEYLRRAKEVDPNIN